MEQYVKLIDDTLNNVSNKAIELWVSFQKGFLADGNELGLLSIPYVRGLAVKYPVVGG
jgi:hypothetical protein